MDRRQKKTRKAIFDAFIALLEKQDFAHITVQEIIDRADVGRATFYAHFETKEYLLKALCEDLFDHVLQAAVGQEHPDGHYRDCPITDEVFLHLLRHFWQDDDHIRRLLSGQNDQLFLRYFKTSLETLVRRWLVIRRPIAAALPEDYVIRHVAATFVETVAWWVEHRLHEPPETIAAYFHTVLQGIVEFPDQGDVPTP